MFEKEVIKAWKYIGNTPSNTEWSLAFSAFELPFIVTSTNIFSFTSEIGFTTNELLKEF
jgi:hypothetical protein